jgi:hypothetical protein
MVKLARVSLHLLSWLSFDAEKLFECDGSSCGDRVVPIALIPR